MSRYATRRAIMRLNRKPSSSSSSSLHSLSWGRFIASSKAWPSSSSSNVQHVLVSLKSSSSCLRLLPPLPVRYIFPPITCFTKQLLRKVWPIQSSFIEPEVPTEFWSGKKLSWSRLSWISSFSLANNAFFEVLTAVTMTVIVLGCDAVSSDRRFDVSQKPAASTWR